VHARHEESRRLEQGHRIIADERQVKIARAWTIRIERRTVLPARSGDGTSPQDDGRSLRYLFSNHSAELIEPRLITSKREPQNVRALLLVSESALNTVGRFIGCQLGIAPMFCVSSGEMAFIITDPCIGTKDAACVDVCPVDCIHPRKDEPEFEQSPMLFIHPDECIDCGACVPACPVSAIYDSPDATPATQKDLIEANAVYRSGDPAAFSAATNVVNAHVSAHPDLMNVPTTERAAAHQA
jgi:NAD-dependent dihydropyrimidine dehydrogenase PreA subunit